MPLKPNPLTTRFRRALPWVVLLGIGALNLLGAALGSRAIQGVALATAASPAPKVFSAVRGLETYSTRFFIEWTDTDGIDHSRELTPELNARILGPYNRRNAYGAVLAYGPVLPEDLRDAVTKYALCGDAPLLRELGIDPQTLAGPVRIRLEPLPGSSLGDLPTQWEPSCTPPPNPR
ncbi:MAG: hypothetical protein AAGI68_05570 [Planctomycetota bacterium]